MSPHVPGAGLRYAALTALLLACPAPTHAYEINGRHWDQMPIPVWVNPSQAPDMGKPAEEVVMDAIAAWANVPCAAVSFQLMGTTTATLAADGMNVVHWINADWPHQESAAGATIWIPTAEGEPPEVDLALNADKYQWVYGGGNALESTKVDPGSVIAHEFGHWLGLSHSPVPYATMYYALLPNGIQATLDPDDKYGVCSLYPNGTMQECQQDSDCPADAASGAIGVCVQLGSYSLCGEKHDTTGDFCSKTLINCEDMCWAGFAECTSLCIFTAFDYSAGYCTNLCQSSQECPSGYTCKEYPQYELSACAPGGPANPDENPEVVELVEDVEVVEGVDTVEPMPDVVDDDGQEDASSDLSVHDAASEDQGESTVDSVAQELGSGDLAGDASMPQPSGKPDSGCASSTSGTSASPLMLLALFLLLLPRIRRFGA